jgi:thiol-disulfide isomerase/thioredoxin
MVKRIPWVLAVLAGWAVTASAAGKLGVGDAAPKLEVKEFVKGEPVAQFEKGKTYVVEFWATWCGPCKESIPHLTALQKKHKDVVFIGVSVSERDPKGVKPFVEKMGDKMNYRVATDDVSGGEGKMSKNWMDASGQEGIPAAFIINGDGKIAWIGHPLEMDEPLAEILGGKYDLQAAAKKYKEEQADKAKLEALAEKLVEAQKAGNLKEVLTLLDKAIADAPKLEERLAPTKFTMLMRTGAKDKALEYAKHLGEKVFKDNAPGLNFVAWTIVDPDAAGKPDAELVKLALTFAERAAELTQHKQAAILDTLAKAYFDNGQAAKAVETQEKAIKLAQGTPEAQDKSMLKRLEQYRKAVKKQ